MYIRYLIVACLGLFTLVYANFAGAATLYVVASDNLRGSSFSNAEVKRILLGEISMLKSGRIRLIYPSYSSSEIYVLSRFVGKGNGVRNLKAYWSKMIFTGKGNPPYTANDKEELRNMLRENNSIGVASDASGLNVIYTIND